MYKLNRFQNMVLKIIGINPKSIVAKAFDVEQALWNRYRDGKAEGYAQGRSETVDCRSCTLYQQATKGAQVCLDPRVQHTGYPQPEPVQSPRQRAITRQLYPRAGDRTRHENDVMQKKSTSKEPDTRILSSAPRPHKMHFHRLYAEPDSTFNAL